MFQFLRPLPAALAAGALATSLLAQDAAPPADLTQLGLEDLANLHVTSVSRKDQELFRSGAPVYVITQEDIRHSGASNIPDLLRMVPGVNVARITANRWAISIRGFNQLYGNKVLVLIDGRSVYINTSSGMFWDQQDVPLSDIERIEVIRGPGGTVWGANAVNGVINIITKNAAATQGALVSAGASTETPVDGLAQYGGTLGKRGAYRVFGHFFNVNSSSFPDGSRAADGWRSSHGGFRADWKLSENDGLMIQGDVLRTFGGQTIFAVYPSALLDTVVNEPVENAVDDVVAQWDHTFAGGSEASLAGYFSRVHRLGEGGEDEDHHIGDLEFQHHFAAGSWNDIVWGFGYRVSGSRVASVQPYAGQFVPDHRFDQLFSAFLQDEILLPHAFSLTVGTKIEHNSYTGLEYEPSAQLVWAPSDRHAFWASVARAIRQPSLVDSSLQTNVAVVPLPDVTGLVTLSGSQNLTTEKLRSVEGGYRTRLARKVSLDISAFLNYYRNLQTFEPQPPYFAPGPPPHLALPEVIGFEASGRSFGAEISVAWNVHKRWKLTPGYSWLDMSVRRDPSSGDTLAELLPGDSPRHQVQLHSVFNVTSRLDWDTNLEYVSALAGVPGHVRADAQVTWHAGESMDLSVGGQNLMSPRRLEFSDGWYVFPTLVPRTVFARITWRF